jgi:hypothetical protein
VENQEKGTGRGRGWGLQGMSGRMKGTFI